MTEGPAEIFRAESGTAIARVRAPIPIFTIDMKGLCERGAKALLDARNTGWRYLIEHPEGLHAVDLREGGHGHPTMLCGHEVGHNLARATRRAERLAEGSRSFEPRILDLNMIGNSVLWLHSAADPGSDRFISLSRTGRELKPVALIERLQRAAIRKLIAMAFAGREGGG
jgi:hypothetical protein